jgi:anti-sigma factor RsiW
MTAGGECRELFARLSEYLDGELDPGTCASITAHLGGCSPCEAFLESLRRTVAWLERSPAPRLPEEMRVEILAAAARLRGRAR